MSDTDLLDLPKRDLSIDHSLLAKVPPDRRDEILREMRRAAMAAQVARYRWLIARQAHRNESGDRLDFEEYPFQRDLYQDEAMDTVIMSATQLGKSEYSICSAIALAAAGLKVLYISAKREFGEKFVKTRIDPSIRTIPLYKKLYEAARKAGKDVDSARIKHLGDGSIIFANVKSPIDAVGTPADVLITDEHQFCAIDGLRVFENRLNGSAWQFRLNMGNPRTIGNDANQNLAWLYSNSDQRKWHVPCLNCKNEQVLDWETHIVKVERTKTNAILRVLPRDTAWKPGGILDMRAICPSCRLPINRLSKEGLWIALNPNHRRHGYQLSNLYNPKVRLDRLFDQYRAATSSPHQMAEFVNNSLGLPYNSEGECITDSMLAQCATGEFGGAGLLEPFRLKPAANIRWLDFRDIDV